MFGKKLMLERRSIRKFEDYYVSDEELKELMTVAQYAPSWANTQTPYFIAVRNAEIIEKIVEECYPKNPATKCSLSSSLLLIACYKKGESGYYKDFDFNEVGTWGMFDTGLACQNIMLRAYEMGLGTVVVGAYNFKKAKEILNLDSQYEISAIMPVGKRINNEIAIPKRKELKDFYRII